MPRSTHSYPAAYILFMLALGLAGWGLLIVAGPDEATSVGATSFFLFLVVIVVARGLAFELLPGTVVSLDSAFYVAAAVGLGAVTAGRLVALALTLDSLFRLLTTRRDAGERGQPVEALAYVLFFGGISGALLTGCGWLFAIDGLDPVDAAEFRVLVTVFAVGGTFLVAHYAIQGLRLRLLGQSLVGYLKNMAVPGVLAEASLLPLTVVVVFIYHPDRPLGFGLLGATYLLINLVFNRLSKATGKLRQRVSELETLNATARRIAASLQLRELVDAVARETVQALPAAESLTLAHLELGGEGTLEIDRYDRASGRFEQSRVECAEGPMAEVMSEGKPLLCHVVPAEPGGEVGEDAVTRSWMGVPIEIYGNVEGVLAVQSPRRGAFGDDELRLLGSIGAQVAVALQNAQLYELAMVDSLTKLFVRRYFDARLEEEVQRAERFGTEFSVIMMDLDFFKDLNDTYGHPEGDRILRDIAEIIHSEMRGVDTAARYGGEEFVMILPRTPLVAAYNQAERIRARVAAHEVLMDGQKIGLTASFGIAAYPTSEARDAAELVRLADRALYRAKQLGRNRVELYWNDRGEAPGRSSLRSL